MQLGWILIYLLGLLFVQNIIFVIIKIIQLLHDKWRLRKMKKDFQVKQKDNSVKYLFNSELATL